MNFWSDLFFLIGGGDDAVLADYFRNHNNQTGLDLFGKLNPSSLMRAFAGQRALVVCDIEGGETALLDPERYPALRAMDLIVELHDSPAARPSVVIPERFGATHDVTMVRHGGRAVALPALFEPLGHLDQLLAVWEWRSGPTPWAVMRARGTA